VEKRVREEREEREMGKEERHEYPRRAKIDKSVALFHISPPLLPLSNIAGIFTHV
jgi:hypothetical protein